MKHIKNIAQDTKNSKDYLYKTVQDCIKFYIMLIKIMNINTKTGGSLPVLFDFYKKTDLFALHKFAQVCIRRAGALTNDAFF